MVGYQDPPGLHGANAALRTMGVDLEMAAGASGTDLVHSHTWYANFAGHTAKLLHGVPHVITSHSLEPLRPGRPTSSAAATRSRPGASGPRSRPPTPSSPSPPG
ncbi:hypothetical protein GCM10027610_078600 [Dactylosporangium cerinum]